MTLGIEHVILFGVPHDHEKDECGSEGFNEDGVIQRAIRQIKQIDPEHECYYAMFVCASIRVMDIVEF